jgi:hypothetical protein
VTAQHGQSIILHVASRLEETQYVPEAYSVEKRRLGKAAKKGKAGPRQKEMWGGQSTDQLLQCCPLSPASSWKPPGR